MNRVIVAGIMTVPVLVACASPTPTAPALTDTPVPVPTMTVTPVPSPTEAPLPEAPNSIPYASVAEALADLTSRTDVVVEVSQGWTIVTDDLTTWSFAPSTHPAYPAVAKRTVYQEDGSWYITLDVSCEGEKAACDQFFRDFQALNDQLREAIEQGQGQ